MEDRLEGTVGPRGKEGDSEVVGKGEEGQVGGLGVGKQQLKCMVYLKRNIFFKKPKLYTMNICL